MKRFGNLYSKIYDMDNLILAHKNARKGKTYYKEVKIVDSNLEKYLSKIQVTLKNKTYNVSKYFIFTKIDKKKEREIFALPYYPDRIIQWAIVQILEPIWMNTLIENTYSSMKHRGIHKGLSKLKKDLRNKNDCKYCLKLDVKKFYPSINHYILKEIIKKKIKDPDVILLLDKIIDSENGIPIGNYLSQYFGNLYLNDFDHWIKEVKHVKYYYRYCDDIVILSSDKCKLHTLLNEIKIYFDINLKLHVKENYQIFPTFVRGIDFLGYRCFGKYTLLRKSTTKTMKRKLIRMSKHEKLTSHDMHVINSYHGWLKWCDGNRLEKKYIEPLIKKEVMRT